MNGQSRAGRKAQIFKVLMRNHYRRGYAPMTCGEIAKKLGMKSSTNIKSMVNELCAEDDRISIDPDYKFWVAVFRPYERIILPERFIEINGRSMRVADWVNCSKNEVQA